MHQCCLRCRKCKNAQECGKYYIKARQETIYAAGGFCFELGKLTYPEMKETFAQLNDEGFNDVDEECSDRVLLLHTYNDCFFHANLTHT